MIKNAQLALLGPGGSGKTTLTEAWSTKHDVPVKRIHTSDYMPEGITSHLDILSMAVNEPQQGIKFQSDLIINRSKLFDELLRSETGYISDRSVVDSYAYYAMHNSMFDNAENADKLYNHTVKSLSSVTATVLLTSPKLDEVENNGIRTSNNYYYNITAAAMHNTFLNLFYENLAIHKTMACSHALNINENLAIELITSPVSNGIILHEHNGMVSVDERIRAIEISLSLIESINTGFSSRSEES